jgi:hypothetical protein
MILVDTTEHGLRLIALVVSIAEIEGDNRLIDKLLVNHVIEGRHDFVDADGIITKAHDSVETAEGESQTGLLSGFSKILVFDDGVANLDGIL